MSLHVDAGCWLISLAEVGEKNLHPTAISLQNKDLINFGAARARQKMLSLVLSELHHCITCRVGGTVASWSVCIF